MVSKLNDLLKPNKKFRYGTKLNNLLRSNEQSKYGSNNKWLKII